MERRWVWLLPYHLSFLNHPDIFNSRECLFRRLEALEPQHGPCSFLYKAMILLCNVVEIFFLANRELFSLTKAFIQRMQGTFIGGTLVNVNNFRSSVFPVKALRKKALAATASLWARSKKSMVYPNLSTAL